MKRRLFLLWMTFSLCALSCNLSSTPPTPTAAATVTKAPTLPPTATPTLPPTLTFTPSVIPSPTSTPPLELYGDARFKDLSALSTMDKYVVRSLWFNLNTVWPAADKTIAADVLEEGKDPGLGVPDLHAQGITGKGVIVAIIDQNMFTDHPQFLGKIIQYKDFGTNTSGEPGSMHGPAVTSLLVGTDIGTAPDTQLFYAAVPSWLEDAQYYADALNWLVDQNALLPADKQIRAVSVSAAPSGTNSTYIHTAAWDTAYQRAMASGLLVLDCTTEHGVTEACFRDPDHPDDFSKCLPGFPDNPYDLTQTDPNKILIPTSPRTTAEEYAQGQYYYQYTGKGGLSWSIPYLTGVLAMGWQLRPDLNGTQMMSYIFQSAYVNSHGAWIIDPPAFIALVKKAP